MWVLYPECGINNGGEAQGIPLCPGNTQGTIHTP